MSAYCQMDTEALEQFSMGRVSEAEKELFEEHLLICPGCQQRFEEVERYVIAMRAASAELRSAPIPKRTWWSLPRLVPALAGVALLAIGFVTVAKFTANQAPRLAISLTATRGTVPGGTVPAGRPLAVTPDLTGITVPGPYRLEVVDERGNVTWQGRYDQADGAAAVPAQRAGAHFVRVYSQSGELLREYGLDVSRLPRFL